MDINSKDNVRNKDIINNHDEIKQINKNNDIGDSKLENENIGKAISMESNGDLGYSAKEKKKSFFGMTWKVTLLILILAIISVSLYAPIKNSIFKETAVTEYIASYDFPHTLADLSMHLNRKELQHKDSYDHKYKNMRNIKYYIKNEETNEFATNIDNLDHNKLQSEIQNSQFYIKATIVDKDNVVIEDLKAKDFLKSDFIDSFKFFHFNEDDLIANVEVEFLVPKQLVYSENDDIFISNMKGFHLQKNMLIIFIVATIGILFLIVLAFAIPYPKQKEASIVRVFNDIYFEFKFLIWVSILLINFGVISTTNYNAPRFLGFDLTTIIFDANWYFYLIGIPITFTIYYLIYLSICYIKHVYHNGFVEGFVKKTMIGKLFFYILHNTKEVADNIVDSDMPREYQKKLLYILFINFIALCLIALAKGFGLVLAFIYSIFLFKYLMGLLNKLGNLNKATKQLSTGDFDMNLPEDLGILSPFARNLNNIKDGFKIAVEEEIKSQNMKTELITNISHDLKTPLTSIITYIDLLKADDANKKLQKEYIDILERKSKRLKVLIDDLFDISKVSSGNIELHLENIDVVALFRQTLGELQEKINKSKLLFRIDLPDNKAICNLDGRRTYRIFENIINNILKYSMKNSRVYIDVEEHKDEVIFVFKNISAYEMNFNSSDIIERFFRGDASRTTDGSGLGLAIAKSLVELQNGELYIAIDGDLFKLTISFPKIKEV